MDESSQQQGNFFRLAPAKREPATDFGIALARARVSQSKKLSQSKLAELAGLDHSYISRLEAGDRAAPKPDTLERIIKALGLSQPEAEALRMAAGYMPADRSTLYRTPLVGKLDEALAIAPDELQLWAQETIRAMLGYLERAGK